jgi:hypothetical protein
VTQMNLNCHARQKTLEDAMRKALTDVNHPNTEVKTSSWLGQRPRKLGLLVGKPEGKRPLRRPRRRWVDNIRMDLQEMGCGCEDWIGLALVSAVRNLRDP